MTRGQAAGARRSVVGRIAAVVGWIAIAGVAGTVAYALLVLVGR